MYRLLADVLNDIAFVLDCLSPAFPKAVRVVVLSFSSVLRALCGVAAGSAKASLSAHFARWGNLGELNAKDSSQETVISLLGMLVGSLVVSWVTKPFATWTTLILLLSVHLETNRRAVRAVSMRTLNRQRATLVYYHLKCGNVPTPQEVSKQEYIFERDGVLKGGDGGTLGFCSVGGSVSRVLKSFGNQHDQTKSSQVASDSLARKLNSFQDQQYIIFPDIRARHKHINIVIKKDASSTDLLTAWWQALALVNDCSSTETNEQTKGPSHVDWQALDAIERTLQEAREMIKKNEENLRKAGWDLDMGALETTSGTRVIVGS